MNRPAAILKKSQSSVLSIAIVLLVNDVSGEDRIGTCGGSLRLKMTSLPNFERMRSIRAKRFSLELNS